MMAELSKLLNVFSREDEERQTAEFAKKLNLPYVNLVGFPIEPPALQVMPEGLAKKYSVVPYQKVNNQIRVATPDPVSPALLPFLRQMATTTNLDFALSVCSKTSLIYTLKQYEFIEEEPPTLEKLEISKQDITAGKGELISLVSIAAKIKATSTSKILSVVFGGAIEVGASDVHIEPEEKQTRVRYRIDGVLQDVVDLPQEVYHQVANRIKYLAKMKLDQQKAAQDGRFDISVDGKPIDVRTSVVPGAWGEAFVMRLLDQSGKMLTLEELGFSPQVRSVLDEAMKKPHGVILNTGPTGSGKTTTLYAMIQKLNEPEVKIITIEDPIEYRIAGVDQTQVKPDVGYTFTNALKSVLRQDPDIIMVGEVRDKDTGEIAMQAALTGHLVLTTLHTNSAPSAIPRLLDMDIAPFLLSGSINVIMAQRLVRRICSSCKGTGRASIKSEVLNPKQYLNSNTQNPTPSLSPPWKGGETGDKKGAWKGGENSSVSSPARIGRDLSPPARGPVQSLPREGAGEVGDACSTCNGTGYKGRIAIAEVLKITPRIEKMIQIKASVSDYERAAREDGMVPMHEDGMEKVKAGITTKEEVERVTSA